MALPEQTRRTLSRSVFETRKAQALANGAGPLRQARLERGLTIAQAANRALISDRTWKRAELEPQLVGRASWDRIAASLGVAVDEITP
jgi:hypothetical protein